MTHLGALASLLSLCLLSAFAGAACVPKYRPPKANEPHAVVKLRRTYETTAGVQLRERALVDGESAYSNTQPSSVAAQPQTDAFLVHPRPARLNVSAGFFHTEQQMVQETYYQQVPYQATESYSCGSGTSYRSCTRSVTRYRSEPKQRWVMRTVERSDGSCEAALDFSPANGANYLLQFTYQESRACSLSCFEQTPLANGQFQNQPCSYAASPPQR